MDLWLCANFSLPLCCLTGLGEEPPDVRRSRGGGGVEGAHQGAVREELCVGARERRAEVVGQLGAARPAVQPAHPGRRQQQHIAAAAAAAATRARHKQQQQRPPGSPRGEPERPAASAQHHLGVIPLPPSTHAQIHTSHGQERKILLVKTTTATVPLAP